MYRRLMLLITMIGQFLLLDVEIIEEEDIDSDALAAAITSARQRTNWRREGVRGEVWFVYRRVSLLLPARVRPFDDGSCRYFISRRTNLIYEGHPILGLRPTPLSDLPAACRWQIIDALRELA